MLPSCSDGALGKTDTNLEAIFADFVTVAIVSRLAQRPVDEAAVDEAVEVLSETIAMCDKLLSGQRREVKLVVADDPATVISSPS